MHYEESILPDWILSELGSHGFNCGVYGNRAMSMLHWYAAKQLSADEDNQSARDHVKKSNGTKYQTNP